MDAARVDVGPRIDESGDDIYVLTCGCIVERSYPSGACGVRVGAYFDQRVNGRKVLRNGCTKQAAFGRSRPWHRDRLPRRQAP